MSGHGGWKHRHLKLRLKRHQRRMKAQASIAQARGLFEAKGQTWEPLANPAQMAAMNHDGRRRVAHSEYRNH
jgi:hypothetical protein